MVGCISEMTTTKQAKTPEAKITKLLKKAKFAEKDWQEMLEKRQEE